MIETRSDPRTGTSAEYCTGCSNEMTDETCRCGKSYENGQRIVCFGKQRRHTHRECTTGGFRANASIVEEL